MLCVLKTREVLCELYFMTFFIWKVDGFLIIITVEISVLICKIARRLSRSTWWMTFWIDFLDQL